MAFLLPVMAKLERREDFIVVGGRNDAHILIQQNHTAAFPFVFG